MDTTKMREQIPALKGVTYLNTGTFGPTPQAVRDAQLQLIAELAAKGPAAPNMLELIQNTKNACRAKIAEFIGADNDEVALTHNTSEGIGVVASGLSWQPGDEVITSDLEHASGLLPWLHYAERFGVRVVTLQGKAGVLTADDFAAAMTDRTRLICMSHVSYASGAQLPVAEVSRLAEERGAIVLVDGAQSAGQLPLNMHELGCHCYALPGQKWMMGPAGTGALYVRRDVLAKVDVSSVGWASVENDDEETDRVQFHPSAQKYEIATMHAPALAGLSAAIDFLQQFGLENVTEQIKRLAVYARDVLSKVPGVKILGPSDASLWTGLLPLQVDGVDPKELVETLWEKHAIVTRWIPKPYCVRLSLHAFITEEEIDKVATAIRGML